MMKTKNNLKNKPVTNQFDSNIDIFTFGSIRKNWAITTMIFKGFYRSFRFPFFTYVQPLFLFVIFFFIFTLDSFNMKPDTIISGYLVLGPASSALFGFGTLLASWKESILLKRIELIQISKMRLILIFISVFSLISLTSFIWFFAWSLLLVQIKHLMEGSADPKFVISTVYKNIRWGYLILGFLLLILTSNAIALIIAGMSNSLNKTQLGLTFMFLISAILGGIIFPNRIIDHSDGLRWASYFLSPYKYVSYIFNYAFHSYITNPYLHNLSDIWKPIIIATVIPVTLITISGFSFRWNV